MGGLRAGGKLWTIVDRSDITLEANICFNLTLHDDLDRVLKICVTRSTCEKIVAWRRYLV
jgi:hypothetical protein